MDGASLTTRSNFGFSVLLKDTSTRIELGKEVFPPGFSTSICTLKRHSQTNVYTCFIVLKTPKRR